MLYPVFLKLTDVSCVVVGGGQVAERKAEQLLKADANVTVVSPELTPTLQELARNHKIHYENRAVQANDLDSATLVIAATDDPEINRIIYEQARERNILVNVVDVPELCTFYVPSLVERGDLTIAISTSGQAPALSRRIRQVLDTFLPTEIAHDVKRLGELRRQRKKAITDEKERSRLAQQEADKVITRYFKKS